MSSAPVAAESVVQLPIEKVRPAADNLRPRGAGDVAELADSIKALGILEPLTVIAKDGEWEVVFGHRRLAAARLAKQATVPAIVRKYGPAERIEVMLVENLQRADLEPLEEAGGYRRLIALGLSQKDLAARVGRSQAHVSKRLSLLTLPEVARTALGAGELPLVDALELVPFAADKDVIAGAVKEIREDRKRGFDPGAARVAKRVQADLAAGAAREKSLAELKAAKVRIVAGPMNGHAELMGPFGGLAITPAKHAAEACHAAYVNQAGKIRYVCTQPSNHARKGGKVDKAAEASKKKAAETRERNKALRAAAPGRTKALAGLITARQSRAGIIDFTLRQLVQMILDRNTRPEELAAQFLGVKTRDVDGGIKWASYLKGGDDRLLRLAYALALGSGELPFIAQVERGYFDSEYAANADRMLEHLVESGYKPVKAEKDLIVSGRNDWRRPFDK
jgi:ParB/RepB/Spo0J family partition protein